jgi:hypothetical protein
MSAQNEPLTTLGRLNQVEITADDQMRTSDAVKEYHSGLLIR